MTESKHPPDGFLEEEAKQNEKLKALAEEEAKRDNERLRPFLEEEAKQNEKLKALAEEEDFDVADLKALGLSAGASQEDIKRAFQRQALQHHPDHGGHAAEFQRIREAYDRLRATRSLSQVVGPHRPESDRDQR